MKSYIYSLLLALILLTSCSISPEKDLSKTNMWSDKSSWGLPLDSIDFSGGILFKDDARIDDHHKKNFPHLHDNYVLWRVKHDGSCWVSSSITLLFYHMIEGGREKYEDVLQRMRSFAKNHIDEKALEGKLESLDELFDIFELVKETMSHSFSLSLRNHQNIYDKLDKGMRILLAAYARSGGLTFSSAQSIESSESWGYATDFHAFFGSLGINYCVIDIADFAIFGADRAIFGHERNTPLPKMLVFHGRLAFIDVLVDKSLSDNIQAELHQ